MGTWSVQSVIGRHAPLNTDKEYGTDWYVTYRIKYTTSRTGFFVEPPKMAWDEIIIFVDFENSQYWEFAGNMYTRKADSPTMAVWAQRYFRAYMHAHGTVLNDWKTGKPAKGHSKLFDTHGTAVPAKALGTHTGAPAQNKAVQDYLKRNGGILEIEVHDIPSVLKAAVGKTKRVERVLVFNCGVTGIGPRVQAWQYVKMDSTQPESTWTYNFQTTGSAPGVKVTGLKKVDPVGVPEGGLPTDGIL